MAARTTDHHEALFLLHPILEPSLPKGQWQQQQRRVAAATARAAAAAAAAIDSAMMMEE